jgi:hypothetical protein
MAVFPRQQISIEVIVVRQEAPSFIGNHHESSAEGPQNINATIALRRLFMNI